MGLEGLYIVLETEELFGIEIADGEARECVTPADLIALVNTRVAAVSSRECLTQRSYYRLRRALRVLRPGLARDTPLDTPLASLVSRNEWPGLWTSIRATAGAPEWPETIPWPSRWLGPGDEPRTVRDLVWYVASSLPPPDPMSREQWTPESVELAIRRIVAQELGQPRGFDKTATFVALGVQ